MGEINFEVILTSILTNYFASFTTPVLIDAKKEVVSFFKKLFKFRPEIENDLKTAKTTEDFERVFEESILASAGSGSIEVEKSFLDALRSIRFDHQNGEISIEGSKVCAPFVQIGGKGSGQTEIRDSVLKSQGAQAKIQGNAKIKIRRDAKMTLS